MSKKSHKSPETLASERKVRRIANLGKTVDVFDPVFVRIQGILQNAGCDDETMTAVQTEVEHGLKNLAYRLVPELRTATPQNTTLKVSL